MLTSPFFRRSPNGSPLRFPLACALLVLGISGCAEVFPAYGFGTKSIVSPSATTKAKMIPLENPMPVRTIETYDPVLKKRVETDVLSLSSAEIRKRLTSTETIVTIEKRDKSGSLSYFGSGGKVSRGSYKVTFDYVNYTTQNLSFNGSGKTSALGRIGVGLRIIADLETSADGVDLSGLLPIGLAAQDEKVTGRLSFLVYGISNDKVAMSVPSQSILDVSSIQKSFEAAAAVRVLFGLEETQLEPYLIGIADVAPSVAYDAMQAGTLKLLY